jgi:hypothetical protein
MLGFHELREACVNGLKTRPSYRSMLCAAVRYDHEELEEILAGASFSIGRLQQILERDIPHVPDEDRLLIDITRSEESPNALHQLLALCHKRVPLRVELEEAGLNFEKLGHLIGKRLQEERTNRSLLSSDWSYAPLTYVPSARRN